MHFLAVLEKRNIRTWIRHVLVPDLNDSTEQLLRLKGMLQGYTCIEKVEFLPFRKLSNTPTRISVCKIQGRKQGRY